MRGILLVTCVGCLGFQVCQAIGASAEPLEQHPSRKKQHVLLLGASVGEGWDIPGLPARKSASQFQFEFIAKYEADKSDVLAKVLARVDGRPDIVILKQCAAYFKGDVAVYDPSFIEGFTRLASAWVEHCRAANVTPVLATVVPITEELPLLSKLKREIKIHLLRRNIRPYYRSVGLRGICDYNDWVKEYGRKNGVAVLDLEAPLSVDTANRYLQDGFTTDGLHLNAKAYEVLDNVLLATLGTIP